jgi:hypothetical protein
MGETLHECKESLVFDFMRGQLEARLHHHMLLLMPQILSTLLTFHNLEEIGKQLWPPPKVSLGESQLEHIKHIHITHIQSYLVHQ